MTGKFPARHGITDWIGAATGEEWRKAGRFNQLLPPEYVHQLPHEYSTLPEAMKESLLGCAVGTVQAAKLAVDVEPFNGGVTL